MNFFIDNFYFFLDEYGDGLWWFLILMLLLTRINPEATISTYKGESWVTMLYTYSHDVPYAMWMYSGGASCDLCFLVMMRWCQNMGYHSDNDGSVFQFYFSLFPFVLLVAYREAQQISP